MAVRALYVLPEPMVVPAWREMKLPQVVRTLGVFWPSLTLCVFEVYSTSLRLYALDVRLSNPGVLTVCYSRAALCVGLWCYVLSALFCAFSGRTCPACTGQV